MPQKVGSQYQFQIRPVLEHYGFDHWRESLGWVAIRCEFHGDTNASASVIEHLDGTGGFNCHVCDIKGDALEIIKKREGIGNFGEAVKCYEGITGLQIGHVSRTTKASPSPRVARLSDRGKRADRSNSRSLQGRSGGRAGRRRPR